VAVWAWALERFQREARVAADLLIYLENQLLVIGSDRSG
jgi:hypothetical protein